MLAFIRVLGSDKRSSLAALLVELLQEVLVNLLFRGTRWLSYSLSCANDALMIQIGCLRRMMARAAILVNELIVLALHRRVEGLVGDLATDSNTCGCSALGVATQV